MLSSRELHRFIIVTIAFTLLVLLGLGVYFAFLKPQETCFDGRQNQDEQGTDCGGICANACVEKIIGVDLERKEVSFVPAGTGSYDVLGQIYNPNDVAGASSFRYVFELKGADGRVLATRSGESYILPQETKYLPAVNVAAPGTVTSVTLVISDVQWERFSGYRERPAVNIYQKRYNQISSGAGFGEAYGLLSNESPYDFRSLSVIVILRDGGGKLLALNTTEMRTVQAGEERDFRLVWPTAFPGTVERVEMTVDADVYHSENFLRQYLPGGRFQEFTPPSAF